METVLSSLKAGEAQGVDPVRFMEKCQRKEVDEEEFARIGPAMAIRYLLAQQKKDRDGKKMVQPRGRRNSDIVMQDIDNADKTDNDEDEHIPVPEGIDLTRVPWDEPWMQSLLSIDTSIKYEGPEGRHRPESDRMGWIEHKDALKMLTGRDDGGKDGRQDAAVDELFAKLSLQS